MSVDPPVVHATWEEMNEAKVPYATRDYCVDHAISLKKCFAKTLRRPFSCADERKVYFRCQRGEYVRRTRIQLKEDGTIE